MRLAKHIEHLLLTENIVVVPDFGCFVVHDMPARYDAQEKAFFPPMRTLGFTTKGVVNDYLLVQSYVDAYDMSLPDAVKEVAKDVDELKEMLYSAGVYDFEGVGKLRFNNNEYDFTPAFASLLTPSSYGLSVLGIESLAQQSVFAKPEEDPVVITIRRSTLHKCTAVAAVAVIALLSVVPIKRATESLQQMQTASVFNINLTEALQRTEPAKTAITKPVAAKKAVVKKAKKQLAPAPDAENAKFTIVLASGITPEGAANYVDSLRSEGINASMTEGKYPQVVYGKYATSADAKNEIAKHASHPRFSVAWIKHI